MARLRRILLELVRASAGVAACLGSTTRAHAEGPAPAPQAPAPQAPAPQAPTVASLESAAQQRELDDKPPLGILPSSADDDALIDPRMARSWASAPPRLFVATAIDVGFVYARPRVSFGYGRPFTSWLGIEGNPIASGAGLGVYSGLRIEIPYLDLRVGSRYYSAFRHTYLDPKESYFRLDLETGDGSKARVLTYEAELDTSLRAGPGGFVARGSVSYVTGVPEGQNVFEETLHVIVRPPLVWRARAGYVFRLGPFAQHSIGLVVDALDVPKRDDSLTVRAGPILRLGLSRRVDVRGSFVVTLKSPDRIGLVGGDFTELGVRYRWATE